MIRRRRFGGESTHEQVWQRDQTHGVFSLPSKIQHVTSSGGGRVQQNSAIGKALRRLKLRQG